MAHQDLGHTESLTGLLRGILTDFRTLIREEIALARAELKEQAGRARGVAISFGITAVALLMGAVFLLAAIATAIADAMEWPAWAVLLGFGVLLSLGASIALVSGRKQLNAMTSARVETVETMKENAAWIANRLSSGRK